MLHLNERLMCYFREHLKMCRNVREKMHFILHLMIHFTVQSRGALEDAPNDALSNLHKDPQEGAFGIALKGALEVVLGLHLCLHLLMQSLIYKFVKKKIVYLMVDLMLH